MKQQPLNETERNLLVDEEMVTELRSQAEEFITMIKNKLTQR